MTPRCATDEPRWSTLSDEGRRDVQARPNFDHDIGLSHEHARNSSNLPCCRRGPCNSSLGDSRQRWRADPLRVLGFDRSWPVLSIAAGGKAMECDPGRGTWGRRSDEGSRPDSRPLLFCLKSSRRSRLPDLLVRRRLHETILKRHRRPNGTPNSNQGLGRRISLEAVLG